MARKGDEGIEARIESLTDSDCPLRTSTRLVQVDGINLLEFLASGEAKVKEVENFGDDNHKYSQSSNLNIKRCAARVLAGECSVYGVQNIVLPEDWTDGAELDDYEGLDLLDLVEDPSAVDRIKIDLVVGPPSDLEDLGPKTVTEDILYG